MSDNGDVDAEDELGKAKLQQPVDSVTNLPKIRRASVEGQDEGTRC